MSSSFGTVLKLQLFGESHGPAVGMCLDGFPAGFRPDLTALQTFLDRRAPGRSALTSARREADRPEFLSGLADGLTCGAPLTAVLPNGDAHPADYAGLEDTPRPSHADYPAAVKYHGAQAASGGGHFSGRLTAPLCVAGGLCLQLLAAQGVGFSPISRRSGASRTARSIPLRRSGRAAAFRCWIPRQARPCARRSRRRQRRGTPSAAWWSVP